MMKPERSKSKSRRSPWVMIISLVLCVLMVGGLVTGALMTMVGAASSSEIQKTINGLKDQAQEIADQGAALQKEIDANQSSTQSTIDQKADIDKQISITEAEIQNSNALIQQYSLLIAEKQSELEDAMARQQEMNETYKARLRAMEETGTISYWAVLFKATSFSDLLSRIDSIQEVAEADQRMLAELESISKEIEEDRQALETERAAQQEIKDALASDFPTEELPMYIVGVAVAAVVGYFAIRLVKTLSDKGKFGSFAYYCWAVGLGSLIAGVVKFTVLAG